MDGSRHSPESNGIFIWQETSFADQESRAMPIVIERSKNKAGQLVCPAMSAIGEKTVAILERAAARDNLDLSISPTFACQTERSDQP